MHDLNIAFCLEDPLYCRRLRDYLTQTAQEETAFHFFTCRQDFQEASEKQAFSVVLAGSSFLEDQLQKRNDTLLILLDEGSVSQELSGYPCIQMFQPADRLIRELYDCIGETGPKDRVFTTGKQCIAITGLVDQGKQHKFTMQLAAKLSEETSVLYVNFMDFPGITHEEEPVSRDLSDLLYYSLTDAERFTLKTRAVISKQDGYDTIPPAVNPENLHELKAEEYERFFRMLIERTTYRVILLDFGFLLPGFRKLMKQFDRVAVLTDQTTEESRRSACQRFFQKAEQGDMIEFINCAEGDLSDWSSRLYKGGDPNG